jgi:parallel beta-helix repeat protein
MENMSLLLSEVNMKTVILCALVLLLPVVLTAQVDTAKSAYTTGQTDAAVTKVANLKLFNAMDYGAVGDSTTNDSLALNNCLAAAVAGRGAMYLPAGVYHCNKLSATSTYYPIVILAEPGAIIDARSAVVDGTSFLGTESNVDSLDASPVRGDTLISSSIATYLVAGDLIHIASSQLWDPQSDVGQVRAEMAEVRAVNGTSIYLKNPLNDDYNKDSCRVWKMNAPQVIIRNLTIWGPTAGLLKGINVQYARDIEISNCTLSGYKYASIYTLDTYGGVIQNNFITDAWIANYGYGICLEFSQNLDVVSNRISDARHAIAIGGPGVSRYIRVVGNRVGTHGAENFWALDGHQGTEGLLFESNQCIGGGVRIAGNNTRFLNNQIYTKAGYGITVNLYGARGGRQMNDMEIRGNTVESMSTQDNGAFLVTFMDSLVHLDNLIIKDNIVKATVDNAIRVQTLSAACVKDTVKTWTSSGNIVDCAGYGIAVEDTDIVVQNLLMSHDQVRTTSDYGLYYQSKPLQGLAILDHCTFYANKTSSAPVRFVNGKDVQIENCVLGVETSTGLTGDYVMIAISGDLRFIWNRLYNLGSNNGMDISCGTAYLYGNIYTNCAGSISKGSTTWAAPASEAW